MAPPVITFARVDGIDRIGKLRGVRRPALGICFAFACNREVAPQSVGTDGPEEVVVAQAQPSERQRKLADARKQAERSAAEDRKLAIAEVDALAVLPAKQPKTLAKACTAMVTGYDRYMRKVLTDDMLTKWVTGGNEMQLKVFRSECMGRTIPVAACQTEGLARLSREQYPRLADLMGRCAEKFGAASEGKSTP